MTETDNSRSTNAFTARDLIYDDLRRSGDLPPGAVVSNYVGVAEILLPTDETLIVRHYPLGGVKGSCERGMLGDAHRDSVSERDAARRRQV